MRIAAEELNVLAESDGYSDACATTEAEYLGKLLSQVRRFPCGCTGRRLWRSRQQFWIRLLPLFTMHECETCGARLLSSKVRNRPVWAVYVRKPGFAETSRLGAAVGLFRSRM
jgi:hypothetical protein